MNKLVAMQTFVRVAESGSFSAAATQLGISVSAVAKTIARLEDELGTRLLERSTRRLALNDDGREFYARAVQILNDVEDAEASLRGGVRTPRPECFCRGREFRRIEQPSPRSLPEWGDQRDRPR